MRHFALIFLAFFGLAHAEPSASRTIRSITTLQIKQPCSPEPMTWVKIPYRSVLIEGVYYFPHDVYAEEVDYNEAGVFWAPEVCTITHLGDG